MTKKDKGEAAKKKATLGWTIRERAPDEAHGVETQDRPKFAPGPRQPGHLVGKMKMPKDVFEPMSEEDLRVWGAQ